MNAAGWGISFVLLLAAWLVAVALLLIVWHWTLAMLRRAKEARRRAL